MTQAWSRYGLSSDARARILLKQDGACAICREVFDKPLFVDHDHRCCPGRGKTCGSCTRGLLCTGCNTKLAALENAAWLSSAESYLATYGSVGSWCKKGHRLVPMPSGACRECARLRARDYYYRRGRQLRRDQRRSDPLVTTVRI